MFLICGFCAVQEAEDVELGNIDAERALTRVRQKLEVIHLSLA